MKLSDLMDRCREGVDEIYVTFEELVDLLQSMPMGPVDEKPQPPVKRRKNVAHASFFFSAKQFHA